jgi:hypothetical protein
MLGKAVGRDRVRLAPVPSPLIWTAAAAGEAASWALRRRVLVSFDRARQATAGCWFCSPRAAIEQLGFSLGAPLVDRLRQTAQWYRAQGLL